VRNAGPPAGLRAIHYPIRLGPGPHWPLRLHRILLPPIRQLTLIVDVPAVKRSRRHYCVPFFIPFTATLDLADDIQGVIVGGSDELAVFGEQALSFQGSHAGGFIGEAEEWTDGRGCEDFVSHGLYLGGVIAGLCPGGWNRGGGLASR